jgi:hypothetical protein
MRRKLTTLRAKQGHSQSAPRQLIDETVYRSFRNNFNVNFNTGDSPHWDPQYSGWSNPSRPRDHNIFLRSVTPIEEIG